MSISYKNQVNRFHYKKTTTFIAVKSSRSRNEAENINPICWNFSGYIILTQKGSHRTYFSCDCLSDFFILASIVPVAIYTPTVIF